MKLNIACPSTGCQKDIDIDDERKLRTLYDMRVSQVVDGSNLGDEFTGESSEPSDAHGRRGLARPRQFLAASRPATAACFAGLR